MVSERISDRRNFPRFALPSKEALQVKVGFRPDEPQMLVEVIEISLAGMQVEVQSFASPPDQGEAVNLLLAFEQGQRFIFVARVAYWNAFEEAGQERLRFGLQFEPLIDSEEKILRQYITRWQQDAKKARNN